MSKQPRRQKNFHHLNPTSRIPELLARLINPSKQLVRTIRRKIFVDKEKHDAWHMLFSNMFAWEAVKQIELWAKPEPDEFRIYLNKKQLEAWNTVFGPNVSPREAIEIVKREWWPEFPTESNCEQFLAIQKKEQKMKKLLLLCVFLPFVLGMFGGDIEEELYSGEKERCSKRCDDVQMSCARACGTLAFFKTDMFDLRERECRVRCEDEREFCDNICDHRAQENYR